MKTKQEKKDDKLPDTAKVILEIEEVLSKKELLLPRELVFKAIIQALFGKMEL